LFKFLNRKPIDKKIQGKNPVNNFDNTGAVLPESEKSEEPVAKEDFLEVPIVEIAPQNTQQITRGVKDRFFSSLKYNMQKIRERITGPHLVFDQLKAGTAYEKKVVISYLKNRANPDLVNEIKDRINKLKITAALDCSYIERGIEDSTYSPFPQIEVTTRPDVVESALLQGRVAIILEGSTNVLIAPTTFFDLMDTP
jgi:hypothetical protein